VSCNAAGRIPVEEVKKFLNEKVKETSWLALLLDWASLQYSWLWCRAASAHKM
jgi:hypothetical protein